MQVGELVWERHRFDHFDLLSAVSGE